MVILLQVIGSHISISQDYIVLMSVRVIIAMNMSITSISVSDIDDFYGNRNQDKVSLVQAWSSFLSALNMSAVTLE